MMSLATADQLAVFSMTEVENIIRPMVYEAVRNELLRIAPTSLSGSFPDRHYSTQQQRNMAYRVPRIPPHMAKELLMVWMNEGDAEEHLATLKVLQQAMPDDFPEDIFDKVEHDA